MLKAFPFMAIAVVLYNAIVLLAGASLAAPITSLRLPSGAEWVLSTGDLLVIFALVTFFIEMVTAANARTSSVVNHGLSTLLFVICGIEFLLVAACGTSTFFIITLLTLIDVIAGYSVSIVAARRDFAFERD